jgi:hypothetical protein
MSLLISHAKSFTLLPPVHPPKESSASIADAYFVDEESTFSDPLKWSERNNLRMILTKC